MLRPLAITTVASFLVASIHPTPSNACGAFFASETSQNLAIDAQRALLIIRKDTLALYLQLAANTDGQPFSWIIPIPQGSAPPTVTLGDQAIFDDLDALTTPTVTIAPGNDSGGGFCGSADAGGGLGVPRGGVQHFGGAELGPYTYDIIAGSNVDALSTWLSDNGYVVPSTFADAFAPYVAKSVFVAVRLTAGPALDGATTEPLVVSWPRAFEGGLGYAFGLSKLSSPEVMPLVLWVLADKRQRVANYGSIELDQVARTMRDQNLGYDAAITALTADAGGRLVTTEFAKDLRPLVLPAALAALVEPTASDAFYLTRLYAAVPRAAIEDLVITFAANAPEVEPAITVSQSTHAPIALASSLLLLVWLRRRHPAPSR